jgi:hypothetical protein
MNTSASSSIFAGKEEAGGRTISFSDHPNIIALAGLVSTQKPTAFTQSDLVLLEVVPVKVFAPIAVDMATKELAWRLT